MHTAGRSERREQAAGGQPGERDRGRAQAGGVHSARTRPLTRARRNAHETRAAGAAPCESAAAQSRRCARWRIADGQEDATAVRRSACRSRPGAAVPDGLRAAHSTAKRPTAADGARGARHRRRRAVVVRHAVPLQTDKKRDAANRRRRSARTAAMLHLLQIRGSEPVRRFRGPIPRK